MINRHPITFNLRNQPCTIFLYTSSTATFYSVPTVPHLKSLLMNVNVWALHLFCIWYHIEYCYQMLQTGKCAPFEQCSIDRFFLFPKDSLFLPQKKCFKKKWFNPGLFLIAMVCINLGKYVLINQSAMLQCQEMEPQERSDTFSNSLSPLSEYVYHLESMQKMEKSIST